MRNPDKALITGFGILWIIYFLIIIAIAGVAVWLGIELVQWIIDGGLKDAIHG